MNKAQLKVHIWALQDGCVRFQNWISKLCCKTEEEICQKQYIRLYKQGILGDNRGLEPKEDTVFFLFCFLKVQLQPDTWATNKDLFALYGPRERSTAAPPPPTPVPLSGSRPAQDHRTALVLTCRDSTAVVKVIIKELNYSSEKALVKSTVKVSIHKWYIFQQYIIMLRQTD